MTGGSKWNLIPPLAMSLAVGVYFVSPALGILKGIAGLKS
jgi:hypothetical protein